MHTLPLLMPVFQDPGPLPVSNTGIILLALLLVLIVLAAVWWQNRR